MARSSVSDAGVMCGSPTAPCDNYLEAGRGRVAVRGQLLDHQVTHHLAGAGRQRVSIGWQKWFLPFALIGRVIVWRAVWWDQRGCAVRPRRAAHRQQLVQPQPQRRRAQLGARAGSEPSEADIEDRQREWRRGSELL
jgi:hypothetical protein